MIFPSQDLGKKIASEDSRTQCQVLEGFASKQLLDITYNNQAIISLVALLPSETILWFIDIYQEIINQHKLPRQTIKYNENFIDDTMKKVRH